MVRRLIKRGAMAGAAVVVAEALYAVLRPVPRLSETDPSGSFGDRSSPTVRVAVLGDSSVTAPGVDNPDDIWVRRVCRRMAEQNHVVLESYAVGGSMAHDLIRDQLEPALLFKPDLVLVSVGANDAIKGISRRRFERNLDILIARLTASGATVIQSGVGDLGTIPRLYPPLREIMTRRSTIFDQVHKSVASRHGSHVVEQRLDGRTIWLEDRELWAADLFHVSAKGHLRWANVAWETIEPLLSRLHGPG